MEHRQHELKTERRRGGADNARLLYKCVKFIFDYINWSCLAHYCRFQGKARRFKYYGHYALNTIQQTTDNRIMSIRLKIKMLSQTPPTYSLQHYHNTKSKLWLQNWLYFWKLQRMKVWAAWHAHTTHRRINRLLNAIWTEKVNFGNKILLAPSNWIVWWIEWEWLQHAYTQYTYCSQCRKKMFNFFASFIGQWWIIWLYMHHMAPHSHKRSSQFDSTASHNSSELFVSYRDTT